MPHNISHFSIHVDDCDRARAFYENVFGWRTTAWGPPGFFLVATGTDSDPGIHGAIQKRREPLSGQGMRGYECTISVDDLDAIGVAIERNGGKILMQKAKIPTVGTLIQFQDTEGNVACAMDYSAK